MAGRQPLLYGHKIALFYEGKPSKSQTNQRMGYLQSTWSTGPQSSAPIGMTELKARDSTPSNFESCIFEIVSGDGDIQQAQGKKLNEEVKFGHNIRLIHVSQGKPLCCSKKRTGTADKNCKRVTIEPANGTLRREWTSKWRIAPRYQVRGEGEKVCDGDQITLQPILSCAAHLLSVGDLPVRGSNFLEASAAPKDARDNDGGRRELGLTIKAYDTEEAAGESLRGGDCIMLYHKELKGYLVGNPELPLQVMLQLDASRGVDEEDPHQSNAMFIVEWEDPLQGGVLQAASWSGAEVGPQSRFRLRLLGNGAEANYLSLRDSDDVYNSENFTSKMGQVAHQLAGKLLQEDNEPSGEELGEHLPSWNAALCPSSDIRQDKGTLFQFLQAGDDSETELYNTSRVILWANEAGMGPHTSQSVFLSVKGLWSMLKDVTATAARDSSKALAPKSSMGCMVGCSERPLQKDGFELRRVPPDIFLSLNSVLSQIPPISEYTKELMAFDSSGQGFTGIEPERLISSLEEMISRCFETPSPYTDVLDYEGTPERSQQVLLVDQSVPKACCILLMKQAELPFSQSELFDPQAEMRQSNWSAAKRISIQAGSFPPRCSLRIARLCYKLIRSSVKGCADLALRVSSSVGMEGLVFMREQINYRRDIVNATPCLVELYTNNKQLQSNTDASFVSAVCTQIIEDRWRKDFLLLLPYVISSGNEVVEKSQQQVTVELLDISEPPFIPLKLVTDTVHIRVPFSGSGDEDNNDESWLPLKDFCEMTSDEIKNPLLTVSGPGATKSMASISSMALRYDEAYEYFRLQMILFACVCLGKSESAKRRAALVFQLIPKDCILQVIYGQHSALIPDSLQCTFLRLASTAFLDDYSNKHYATTHLVKVWDRFDEDMVKFVCEPQVEPLKVYILSYIKNNSSHDCRNQMHIRRTSCVIRLLFLFVRSGFITKPELTPLCNSLIDVLDGTTDTYMPADNDMKHCNEPSESLRREYTEGSRILLYLRSEVIEVLEMLLDYVALFDLQNILTQVKKYIEGTTQTLELPHLSQLQSFDTESNIDSVSEQNYVAPSEGNILSQGLGFLTDGVLGGLGAIADLGAKVTSFIPGFSEGEKPYPQLNRVIEVLLDCAQYRYQPLRCQAASLLFRLCNRGTHLAETLVHTQLLSTDGSITFYNAARDASENLSEVLQGRHDDILSEVLKFSNDFKQKCYSRDGTPSVEQQWSLVQLNISGMLLKGFLESLVETLARQDPTEDSVLHMSRLNTCKAVFEFFMSLCERNTDNLEAFDPFISIIVSYLPYGVGALSLLDVMFSGQTRRCIAAPDILVRGLLHGTYAPHLLLLKKIMRPETRNIFSNQQSIYTLVSDTEDTNSSSVLNFVGTTDFNAWTGRKKLKGVEDKLRHMEHLNLKGAIAGHLSTCSLLFSIGKGKELSLKREIRNDLWTEKYADPVEHVVNTISRPEFPQWYKAEYVRLFTEVFVDDPELIPVLSTQQMRDGKIAHNKILQTLLNDLKSWPPSNQSSVKQQPSSPTVSFSEADASLRNEISGIGLSDVCVVVDYLFFAVIPCLKHLMVNHIGRSRETTEESEEEAVQLYIKIIEKVYEIAEHQRTELTQSVPPGVVPKDSTGEAKSLSYVKLVEYACKHPDKPHPLSGNKSLLLPGYVRSKIAEFLRVAHGFSDKLPGCTFYPELGEALIEVAREHKSPRVITREEELFVKWRQALRGFQDSPVLNPDSQFRSLCLLLLRKGELGKQFIQSTIIGKENEGTIFQRGHPTLQLDSLKLLARLCDNYPAVLLQNGKGGDDANIVLPTTILYLPVIITEEDNADEDRVRVAADMEVIAKQNALNSFGMAEKLVSLVEAPSSTGFGISTTTMTALTTGSALLNGGNAEVQGSILNYFLSKNDESFFIHIRGQLRKFADTLKDLRRTLKKEVTKGKKNDAAPDDDDDDNEVPIDLKTQPIPDHIIVDMSDRFCVTHMGVLLRFLQLLTEGHNDEMQNYLREQPDNQTSIDLVEAVVTFLQQFKYCNRITADVQIATLECLIEAVQGPCSDNQSEIVSFNIGESLCMILNDGPGPQMYKADLSSSKEGLVHLWTLRNRSVELLVALTEGAVLVSVAKLLLSSIRLDVLADNMRLSYSESGLGKDTNMFSDALGAGLSVIQDLVKPEGSGSELDDKLNLGCGIFIFFKVMLDQQVLRERELGNKEPVVWTDRDGRSIKQVLRRKENAPYQHFNQTVATIEIARGDIVERVYFRVLVKSRVNLPERSMNDVKNTVQRESGDGVRVADFFDKCIGLIHEIDYYEEMRNTRGLAIVHKFSVPLEWLSLAMSFAINLFLLTRVSFVNDDTVARVKPGDEEQILDSMGRGIIVLQALQWIHFAMGPTRIYLDFQWRTWLQDREDAAMRTCKANLSIHPVDREAYKKEHISPPVVFATTLVMIAKFWPFWQRALYLICSFLGYYVTPVWYCFQPLQVTSFSPKLMNVVLAVTTNGKSLLLTFGLMIIVVYMFAIWAFFRFSNYFDEEGDFGVGFNCDSLLRCWLLLMTYGLRQGGGMGDILMRPNWSDDLVGERILFDVLYFLLLIILFLNIVFGIIIDTFAELREKRAFIEDDQQSKCFICGLERSVFDREAGAQGGFEHHYKYEHNMWTYLLFLHYINEKSVDNLTGQEKYVYDMVANKDPGFFPVGKSLVLSNQNDEDIVEQIAEKMADKQSLDKMNNSLFNQIQAFENKMLTLLRGKNKGPRVGIADDKIAASGE